MLRTLAAEAARRFGERVSFAVVRPPARAGAAEPAAAAQDSWFLTYADLDRLSDEAAAGLAFRGVLPGDVVAIALPNTPEFPICYLAAVKIGAVIAGLDPRWPPVVLDQLTELLRPTVTVAPFGLGIGPGPDGELVRITLAHDGRAALTGFRRPGPPPPPLPPDTARPAVIAITSGRTGARCGAVFGVSQLDAIRKAEAGDRWGSGAGGVILTTIPFAHYSFMTRLPAMLQTGRSYYPVDSWRGDQLLDGAAALQATQLTALPGQLAELAAQPADPVGPAAAPPLQLIVTADEAPPVGLIPGLCERLRGHVEVRYGCAEAGLGLRTAAEDLEGYVEGCVGSPAPGVTLDLRDSGGLEVAHGEPGEVLLRSAACMGGYWNDAQASSAAFTSDRFARTGDRGRLDERGRLVLVQPGA